MLFTAFFAAITIFNLRMGHYPVYQYEHSEWPTATWDSNALQALLAEVHLAQGRLLGRLQEVGFETQTEAYLRSLSAESIATAAIEGEKLEPESVRSSIARHLGLPSSLPTAKHRAIEGIVEVTLDATRNANQLLTKERIWKWHRWLFPDGKSNGYKLVVGQWRDDSTGPMQVVSGALGKEKVHYQAPPASVLGEEMNHFLAWFNDAATVPDLVLKAGIAHWWFLTLHPLDDGNGRVARALTEMLLTRSEHGAQRFYSFSAQILKERNAYYTILEKTQKGSLDITPWLAWFLDCLLNALKASQDTLADILFKAQFWRFHAQTPFNDRQRKVLNKLLDGFEGPLTSSKWYKIGRCSQDTAQRDIADLLERRVLEKNQGKGRSTSYRLAALPGQL